MDKCVEELKSIGDMEELRGKMQAAMKTMAADINKKIISFQASDSVKDGELQACKVEVEAWKVEV